jgi:hypothetical protein
VLPARFINKEALWSSFARHRDARRRRVLPRFILRRDILQCVVDDGSNDETVGFGDVSSAKDDAARLFALVCGNKNVPQVMHV